MQTTASEPRIPSQAELCIAVRSTVALFRSGLPTIERWRDVLLAIPFEYWQHRVTSERDEVRETVSLFSVTPDAELECTFSLVSTVGADLSQSVKPTAECCYRLQSEKSLEEDGKLPLHRLNLDNYPETITGIVELLRARLIEPALFEQKVSAAVHQAREWKQNDLWGRAQLTAALTSTPASQDIPHENAHFLASSCLRRLRPPSEEGDFYELEDVLAARRLTLSGVTLSVIQFSAPMSDRNGESYPSEFLYVLVDEAGAARPRAAEYLFDKCWGPDFCAF